jgi:hypothetical protein
VAGVLLGLTAEEYIVLASAVVPFLLAILVVVVFWRWSLRDEARHRAEDEERRREDSRNRE